MEDDRHPGLVGGVGTRADRGAHGACGPLQRDGVGAAQRVQPARIDHPVGGRLDGAPPDAAGVFAHRMELGGGGEGGQQGRQQGKNPSVDRKSVV